MKMAFNLINRRYLTVIPKYKDTVIRSFVKYGIPLPIFGSRDSEINIDGLPGLPHACFSRCRGNRILL